MVGHIVLMHSGVLILVENSFEKKEWVDMTWTSDKIGRLEALDGHDLDFEIHFHILSVMEFASVQCLIIQYTSIKYPRIEK